MLKTVPSEVSEGEKFLFGDVDAFIESLESGAEAKEYDRLCKFWLTKTDREIKTLIGSSVVLPGCI